MKKYIPKRLLSKIPGKAKRAIALVLCAALTLSLFTFILPTRAYGGSDVDPNNPFWNLYIREADKNTMDSYVQASLGGLLYLQWGADGVELDGVSTATVRNNYGTRYAGEVWADKSVFALGQNVIAEIRPFEAGHVYSPTKEVKTIYNNTDGNVKIIGENKTTDGVITSYTVTELDRAVQTLYYWLGKDFSFGDFGFEDLDAFKKTLSDGALTTDQATALNAAINAAIAGWAKDERNGYSYVSDGDFNGTTLILGRDTDGVNAKIKMGKYSDFLHVFSVLGSSEQYVDNGPYDVVFVVDVSASMARDADTDNYRPGQMLDNGRTITISGTKMYQAMKALDESIASLMELHPENRCAVVLFASRPYVLMPLAHYEPGNQETGLTHEEDDGSLFDIGEDGYAGHNEPLGPDQTAIEDGHNFYGDNGYEHYDTGYIGKYISYTEKKSARWVGHYLLTDDDGHVVAYDWGKDPETGDEVLGFWKAGVYRSRSNNTALDGYARSDYYHEAVSDPSILEKVTGGVDLSPLKGYTLGAYLDGKYLDGDFVLVRPGDLRGTAPLLDDDGYVVMIDGVGGTENGYYNGTDAKGGLWRGYYYSDEDGYSYWYAFDVEGIDGEEGTYYPAKLTSLGISEEDVEKLNSTGYRVRPTGQNANGVQNDVAYDNNWYIYGKEYFSGYFYVVDSKGDRVLDSDDSPVMIDEAWSGLWKGYSSSSTNKQHVPYNTSKPKIDFTKDIPANITWEAVRNNYAFANLDGSKDPVVAGTAPYFVYFATYEDNPNQLYFDIHAIAFTEDEDVATGDNGQFHNAITTEPSGDNPSDWVYNGGKFNTDKSDWSDGLDGATSMDAGFWVGMSLLAERDDDDLIVEINGRQVCRAPSLVFLGDGEPTFAMSGMTVDTDNELLQASAVTRNFNWKKWYENTKSGTQYDSNIFGSYDYFNSELNNSEDPAFRTAFYERSITENWWSFPDPLRTNYYPYGTGETYHSTYEALRDSDLELDWRLWKAIDELPIYTSDTPDGEKYLGHTYSSDGGLAFVTILRAALMKAAVTNRYKMAAEKANAVNADTLKLGFYTIGVGLGNESTGTEGAARATLDPGTYLKGEDTNKVTEAVYDSWQEMLKKNKPKHEIYSGFRIENKYEDEKTDEYDEPFEDEWGAARFGYNGIDEGTFWVVRNPWTNYYRFLWFDIYGHAKNYNLRAYIDADANYNNSVNNGDTASRNHGYYDYTEIIAKYGMYLSWTNNPPSQELHEMVPWTVEFALFPEEGVDVQPYGTTSGASTIHVTAKQFYDIMAEGYTDQYFDVNHSGELATVFEDIMTLIAADPFQSVKGSNSAGFDDSLTYSDPVGDYMTVDSVTDLTLFGHHYKVEKWAVYDYAVNGALLKQGFRQSNDPETEEYNFIQEGWYKEQIDDKGNITYSQYQGEKLSDAEMWADGWVYYISFTTAQQYVSVSNQVENYGDLSDKQQNTTYTAYRIVADVTGNGVPINGTVAPKIDEKLIAKGDYENAQDQNNYGSTKRVNLSTGAIFDLWDDIRIWVEDTGEWRDYTGTDFIVDDAYGMALFVNIGVNALPSQIATVYRQINKDGSATPYEYETNLGKPEASTPLRVFYNVSLDPDYLRYEAGSYGDKKSAAGVSLSKISPEYLEKNTRTDFTSTSDKFVEGGRYTAFYSNYFTDSVYDKYAVVSDPNKESRGNATVTFSPSTENQFYRFQKNRILFLIPGPYGSTDRPAEIDFGDLTNVWYTSDGNGGIKDLYDYSSVTTENGDTKTTQYFLTNRRDGTTYTRSSPNGDWMHGNDKLTGVEQLDPTNFEHLLMVLNAYREDMDWDGTNKKSTFFDNGDCMPVDGGNYTTGDGKTEPQINSDNWYYIIREFYYPIYESGEEKATEQVEVRYMAIARKGKELGTGVGSGKDEYVCWYSPEYDDWYETEYAKYLEELKEYEESQTGEKPEWKWSGSNVAKFDQDVTNNGKPDGNKITDESGLPYYVGEEVNWYVSAAVGGLRVGSLANFAGVKGYDIREGVGEGEFTKDKNKIAEANVTDTAKTYFLPTISTSSGSGQTKAYNITVNAYLGNNGRILVDDSTLVVTKTVRGAGDSQSDTFTFDIWIEGFTGERGAVLITRDEFSPDLWRRRFDTIDVLASNQDLLLGDDNNRAMVDADGQRVIAVEETVNGKTVTNYYYAYKEDGEVVKGREPKDENELKEYSKDETVTVNGKTYIRDSLNGSIIASGEKVVGGVYYVYVAQNLRTGLYNDKTLRVFKADVQQDANGYVTNLSAGDIYGNKSLRGGRTYYLTASQYYALSDDVKKTGLVVIDENDMGPGGNGGRFTAEERNIIEEIKNSGYYKDNSEIGKAFVFHIIAENTGTGYKPGDREFWINRVWLIPIDKVDTDWQKKIGTYEGGYDPDNPDGDNDDNDWRSGNSAEEIFTKPEDSEVDFSDLKEAGYILKPQLKVAHIRTMDGSGATTATELASNNGFYITSQFLTTKVTFTKSTDHPGYGKATVTLTDGHGLGFNNIDNEAKYVVTERIARAQDSAGIRFEQVDHVQKDGLRTRYQYESGNPITNGVTYDSPWTYDSDGNKWYDGPWGTLGQNVTIWESKQGDNTYWENGAWQNGAVDMTADFSKATSPGSNHQQQYTVAGKTSSNEQAAHYVNFLPDILKVEFTPGEGESVYTDDLITYGVSWENFAFDTTSGESQQSTVTITDVLDPGVTFVSAVFNPVHSNLLDVAEGDGDSVNNFDEAMFQKEYARLLELQRKKDELTPEEGDEWTPEEEAELKELKDRWQPDRDLTLKAGDENPAEKIYKTNDIPNLDGLRYTDPNKNDTMTVTITYTEPTKDDNGNELTGGTVTWVINDAPADASGFVELTVRVNTKASWGWDYKGDDSLDADWRNPNEPDNEKAADNKVDNRASVSSGGITHHTNIVTNPTGHIEKVETTPGNGLQVMVGDQVDYYVGFNNPTSDEATITVEDRLDPGVYFYRAWVEGSEGTKTIVELKATGEDGKVKVYPYDDENQAVLSTDGTVENAMILMGEAEVTVTITYDPESHLITWTLEGVPAMYSGRVYFSVIVNEKAYSIWDNMDAAPKDVEGGYSWSKEEPYPKPEWGKTDDKDDRIYNRARVQVGESDWHYTEIIENPLKPEKKEVTPGENEGVLLGQWITYTITWQNNNEEGEPANVTIVDKLDPGVDFVEAGIIDRKGNKTPILSRDDDETEKTDTETGFTVRLETANGITIVTWTMEEVAFRETGMVYLTVEVNERAFENWQYDRDNGDITQGRGEDGEVVNKAGVTVGNKDTQYTDVVKNPVETPTPEKDEITPGDGKKVTVGQDITYEVTWFNDAISKNDGQPTESTVTIYDRLDPGVDFKSAWFGDTSAEPKEMPEEVRVENGDGTYISTWTYTEAAEDGEIVCTIVYNSATHTVIWTLPDREAKAEGVVSLRVKVNNQAKVKYDYEKDGKDYGEGDDSWGFTGGTGTDNMVYNQAYVDVENGSKQFTKIVKNPVETDSGGTTPQPGNPHKTEVTPGNGKTVKVGEDITYRIHWENDAAIGTANIASTVTIIDKLDPGVDFKEASYGAVVLKASADNGDVSVTVGDVTIEYSRSTHTVTWILANRGILATGDVYLVVTVNESAYDSWHYNKSKGTYRDDWDILPGDGTDSMVYNQARVKVDNGSDQLTEIPENPLEKPKDTEKPKKTETDPGNGETVEVGQEITYEITWKNDAVQDGQFVSATVTIIDRLDPGVDFVGAGFRGEAAGCSVSYDPSTHTVTWTLPNRAAEAEGTVWLTVKVNENARHAYDYNGEDGDEWTIEGGDGLDWKVVNQARVIVDNGSDQFTDIPENPLTPPPDIPKTGDDSHLGFWISLLGLSVAGLAVSVICTVKKADPNNAKDSKKRK